MLSKGYIIILIQGKRKGWELLLNSDIIESRLFTGVVRSAVDKNRRDNGQE
jgi:hypothetical protein